MLLPTRLLTIPLVCAAASGFALAADATSPDSVLEVATASGYRFTPQLKQAYVAYAKATALQELKAANRELPEDFLKWVDSDPVVAATVYGARKDAANVLVMLRSLELDLGAAAVRKDQTQLALAMAVVHAAEAPKADLSPRQPLRVVIPGDPRKPVDTKDPKRKLDQNDHIINFLNDNIIVEDVVVGYKEEPPPLVYDEKGVAIPQKGQKKVKTPVTEKRSRPLYGSDIIASRFLQEKFNAYMKAHGCDVKIDCGDQVVSWKSTAAVKGERKAISEAFHLFRAAYEAKGLLPAARDPFPTPGESAAYYIRNNNYVFPPETRAKRDWPRYPLDSPWPTLTLLAADDQPLREREERWLAFRDNGEMRTYGEYIGPIAQQFDMQSARRVSPYPFSYNTYQMMAKDGGVCGTMANMGVRTYNTLGIPATTAGQPGHCALIMFAYDPKSRTYECKGGQFASGGPEVTKPHTPWVFGDTDGRRDMLYYQSIAWAVNCGVQSYLDTTIAWRVFQLLPDAAKPGDGLKLLLSAIPSNPYNILLTDSALDSAAGPAEVILVSQAIATALAAQNRPGCPKDGYYANAMLAKAYGRLAKLPVPTDTAKAREILAFLTAAKIPDAKALVHYRVALDGIKSVKDATASGVRAHLARGLSRTDDSCKLLAENIRATADAMPARQQGRTWAAGLLKDSLARAGYLGKRNRITLDPAVAELAKLAGVSPPDEAALQATVLPVFRTELATRLNGPRDPKEANAFAARVTAVAGQIADWAARRAWLQSLDSMMKGRETFAVGKKTVRDPAATAIAKLLAAPKPAAPAK